MHYYSSEDYRRNDFCTVLEKTLIQTHLRSYVVCKHRT